MAEALQRSSPALLKMRGLHNLNEFLKVGSQARLRHAPVIPLSAWANE